MKLCKECGCPMLRKGQSRKTRIAAMEKLLRQAINGNTIPNLATWQAAVRDQFPHLCDHKFIDSTSLFEMRLDPTKMIYFYLFIYPIIGCGAAANKIPHSRLFWCHLMLIALFWPVVLVYDGLFSLVMTIDDWRVHRRIWRNYERRIDGITGRKM